MFDKIWFHLSRPWFRPLLTLYFNFRLLPWRQACKLPILIYGPVKFFWLKGKVVIRASEIFRGMITLGKNNEFFDGDDGSAFVYMSENSTIIFNGPCALGNNYNLRVGVNATLELGAYTFFGASVKIICAEHIRVGDYTRIAYESQLVDTNSHYVYNEKTGSAAPKQGSIEIGRANWIGNRATINKGAHTKDMTIVSANSMLNKDYTRLPEENQMLGGTPAKLITSGLHRIFSTSIDKVIDQHYIIEKSTQPYIFSKPLEDTFDDVEYWFKHIM